MELVFVHGRAAAGKLTTARALERILGYPVFHNHLVVDLLTTMFPFGSEAFVRLREQFWLAVFVEAARADRSIIFTFTPERTVVDGFAERVRDEVSAAGGTVRFVRLTVSDAEQECRVINPSRREFHKINDLAALSRLRARREDVEQPPTELEIHTDHSGPVESAARIVAHFQLSAQPSSARYP